MEANGLDDAAMAARLGVSSFAVKKWRYGERTPRPAQMEAIISATGGEVRPNDFFADARTDHPVRNGEAA